jgi:hypothetical protein
MYDEVLAYGNEKGSYAVPWNHFVVAPDGARLHVGEWLRTQRTYKRADTLESYREEMLDALADDEHEAAKVHKHGPSLY